MIGDDQLAQLPIIRSAVQWSDARNAELGRLWVDGVSAALIADAVNKIGSSQNRITRHAVIGQARRLKLGEHPNVKNRRAAGDAERVRRAARVERTKLRQNTKAKVSLSNIGSWTQSTEPVAPEPPDMTPTIADSEIPVGQRTTLLDSEVGKCRWPVGDPLKSDFYFCGGDTVAGKSYCVGHQRNAYRAGSSRR